MSQYYNNMKKIILANNKYQLQRLIETEITLHGNACNLNHIDVSKITDMGSLFYDSPFIGDISSWDTSQVECMDNMFCCSKFNGDISNFNTSKVKSMNTMFSDSKFNGDISKWDVSNVESIYQMFNDSQCLCDLSHWKLLKLEMNLFINETFYNCKMPIPYWANYVNPEQRIAAIHAFELYEELDNNLINNNNNSRRVKI